MVSMVILSFIALIQSNGCTAQEKESDTNHPVTKGCYYKGRYHHGNWEDGCDHLCTCLNPHTGHYKCRRRCPRYKALPRNCFLILPPGGKCCKQPQCTRHDNRKSYNPQAETTYRKDYLNLKNVNLTRKNPRKETDKIDIQIRNPSIFENPNYITHRSYDNQSKLFRYTTPDTDDSMQSFADTVTHTFFVTQKSTHIFNDRSQNTDRGDIQIPVPQVSPNFNSTENKSERFTDHNNTKQNNEIFSAYPENQMETNGNSNDSDGSQPDNTDVSTSELLINETKTHKSAELQTNETHSNVSNPGVTTRSSFGSNLKEENTGETQSNKNMNNGKDDNDQPENDNLRTKENRLLNLVILNNRISSEIEKRRATNYNILSTRKDASENMQSESMLGLESLKIKTKRGVPRSKITDNQTSPIQSTPKASDNNVQRKMDKPNIRNLSDAKKFPRNGMNSKVYRRPSVTFKPMIPLYSNSSLKYKDKDWGKFVKELTHMFMEVNRLKENKLKLKTNLALTQMTTKQPRARIFYDRPREYFYGKGQLKPAADLKLKILDKEYITKKKPVRPFRVRDCYHEHKRYRPGEKWRDQCNQTCSCSFDGRYECSKERCLSQSDVPPGCHVVTQRIGCCPTLDCPGKMKETPTARFKNPIHRIPSGTIHRPWQNVKFIRTSTGMIRLDHPANGAKEWVGTFVPNIKRNQNAFCLYKNRKYMTGEVWLDGCNSCRCLNGMFGRYTCHVRCPAFASIPNNCSLHIMSKRQCCPVIKCNNRLVTTTLRNAVLSPLLQSYFDIQSRTTASPFKVDNISGYKISQKHNGNRDRTIREQFHRVLNQTVSRNYPRGKR